MKGMPVLVIPEKLTELANKVIKKLAMQSSSGESDAENNNYRNFATMSSKELSQKIEESLNDYGEKERGHLEQAFERLKRGILALKPDILDAEELEDVVLKEALITAYCGEFCRRSWPEFKTEVKTTNEIDNFSHASDEGQATSQTRVKNNLRGNEEPNEKLRFIYFFLVNASPLLISGQGRGKPAEEAQAVSILTVGTSKFLNRWEYRTLSEFSKKILWRALVLKVARRIRWEHEEALKHALCSAVSAIMSRNMSHNIGSHVLNYLSDPEVLDEIWVT